MLEPIIELEAPISPTSGPGFILFSRNNFGSDHFEPEKETL